MPTLKKTVKKYSVKLDVFLYVESTSEDEVKDLVKELAINACYNDHPVARCDVVMRSIHEEGTH